MSVLERILETKRRELADLRGLALPTPPPARQLALRRAPGERLRLIAEIKRRSPSAGALSTVLDVAARARAYERAGADVISVLCDSTYFDGSYAHLAEARRATSVPLLCKEFVIDEVQLDVARAYGADLVLLIVRCLTAPELERLVAAARARGLAPLVEVHAPPEVEAALAAGADLIGVNARDLGTLQMNLEQARAVLAALPPNVIKLHLSGLQTPEQVRDVAGSSADAALIGEALMRRDDPTELLAALVAAAG